MKFESTGIDRKELVEALERETGIKKTYSGAPSFSYVVGVYTVLRDGSVEVADADADTDMIRKFIAKGLLQGERPDAGSLSITIPLDGMDGQAVMNLINMIHSRQYLLNQSVGRPGAFHIDEKARQKLEVEMPLEASGFSDKMERIGRDKFKGILITTDKLAFTGFPLTEDPAIVRTYTRLAALMVKQAKERKRVKAQTVDATNQKYSFRVWLMGLGMKSSDYREDRRILLQNLDGNSAFRTPEQKEIFSNRMKEKREKEKERKALEFQPL